MKKGKEKRYQYEMLCLENLAPSDHLFSTIDFKKIYNFAEELYCDDNGRPSIDPVVLFKMVLIQHLNGIPSLRRTAEEARANNYYRWFLAAECRKEHRT